MPAAWPSPEEIEALPTDQLGMRVLWRLVALSEQNPSDPRFLRQGFIEAEVMEAVKARKSGPSVTTSWEGLHALPGVARALAEAWDWLVGEGLIAIDPLRVQRGTTVIGTVYFVTRLGKEVAKQGVKGLGEIRARRRLGVELHPKLEREIRNLVRSGALEEAAFKALRQVEIEVRSLADDPTDAQGRSLVGDTLITEALRVGGPLADSQAEDAEQQGLMFLFKGAFGAVRNPLGHRSIEWDDPTEAAEMVLLADLLMRQLGHIADRLAQSDGNGTAASSTEES